MRGLPEEQPVLSQNREEEACVSEEGQSFRGRKTGRRDGKRGYFLQRKNTIITNKQSKNN